MRSGLLACLVVIVLAGAFGCGTERGGGGGFSPIPALVTASPAGDACALGAPAGGLFASYRKDRYLPSEVYSEPTEPPLDGGRVQIAGIAERSCRVTGVRIEGVDVQELISQLALDWYHVWPSELVAGEPVWVAFHSRQSRWDHVAESRLQVMCADGPALDGPFPVQTTDVPLGYVTTSAAMDELIIHVESQAGADRTLERLLVNGREVFQADVAVVASPIVPAGGHALWTVPLCTPAAPGDAWTVVAEYAEAKPAVGVGRVLKPHFPIEAWPSSSECPLPGVNDAAFDLLNGGGIDTLYVYFNSWQSCGYDQMEMLTQTLPARGDTFLLLGDDFPWDDPPAEPIADTSAILGFLTGDESDWDYLDDDGSPRPAAKARKARALWDLYPELATYNGAMTNKHIGAFAGMTDVQGIDIYAAGCAPHILAFGDAPPLRAPYDYLKNARDNHMPLPTWLYAQGLGGWVAQPEPQEILTQALMVAAAGGKGLMWFQAKKSLADEAPDTWRAMVRANRLFMGMRRHLRAGDVTGLARCDEGTIVEAIRSPEAIVVPVINVSTSQAPTDSACVQAQLGAIDAPHFVLEDRLVTVSLPIPDDARVEEIFELTPDGPVDLAYPVRVDGRSLTIDQIPLGNEVPVRVFVLVSNPDLRTVSANDLVR